MKRLGIIVSFLLILSSTTGYAKGNTEKAGDVLALLIPATAYSSTYVYGDEEGRKQFYKSFLSSAVATGVLKYSINKKRPENNGKHSFPSGHTSIAFQGAAFIHKRYGLKYGIPAYIAASYVGWSRVDSKQHFTSDVVAGAAIGALSSYYFTTPYKNLSIKPVSDRNTLGVSVSYQW